MNHPEMPDRRGRTKAPRVLVHLPNWLGDVVMTTPLLNILSEAIARLPDIERPTLHLAVRKPWSVLFADDPRFDDVLPIDRGGQHGGLAGIWRQALEIRRGQYDAVILGPPSFRAGLTAGLAGVSCRVGYATDGRGLLLNQGLAAGPRGSRHFSFEMISLGLSLLENLQISAPALPTSGLPLATLPGCAAMVATSGVGDRPLWLVAPGTTYGEAKTWPLSRMAEFVELAATEARIVLVGDAQASDFAVAMRRESPLLWSEDLSVESQVVDLTGQTNLRQVVQLMKSASAFVGNDSGLMHLAGALALPTVGVFGSSNPDWTHPLGARTAAVVAEGFECRPCYRKTCNEPRFCLETVSAASVMATVHKLLATPVPSQEEN